MTPKPQANTLDESELADEILEITEKLGELNVKYILYVDSCMGGNIQAESQVLPPKIEALIKEARIDECEQLMALKWSVDDRLKQLMGGEK